MGIPPAWHTVQAWLDPDQGVPKPAPTEIQTKCKKSPEILKLSHYHGTAPNEFWDNFPTRPLPTAPSTPICHHNLIQLVHSLGKKFSISQLARVSVLVDELKFGVSLPLSLILPAMSLANSPSVNSHGEEFTDVLAWWVKKGFVSGPFADPPCENFRVNQMLAVEQHGKVRIVMNLSGPDGQSFNDAVIDIALEKVTMSTARQFGYSVADCGPGARLWKWDMDSAYKNLPARVEDLRLQGFQWLGRLFVENRQAFGAKTAVAAFDRLGQVVAELALEASSLPRPFFHRTLDDLPIVTTASSQHGPEFARHYKHICKKVGIELAENCPKQVKAFEDVTEGTVLGIRFHTPNLTWSISAEKYNKILNTFRGPVLGEPVDLLAMQKIMGQLNDLCQMCSFARGFRHKLYEFLAKLTEDPEVLYPLPQQARAELGICLRMAASALGGLPIPHRPLPPSLKALTFVSDAAGAKFVKVQDRFVPYSDQDGRGAASISAVEDGPVWFYGSVTWPEKFLLEARDAKDHAYGCKSPTLEVIALILPFLCCPETLLDKEVLLLTDNEPVVYGWDSLKIANDESASIFIRTLHIISFYLGTRITVQHLPRMSTQSACLADRLTRSSTTGTEEQAAVRMAMTGTVPSDLMNWLHCPSEDWSLPARLLSAVQRKLAQKGIYLP